MFDESYLVRQAPTPQGYRRRQSGLYEPSQPMVRFADGPASGQNRMSWALDINGQRVSPTCVYLASDINTGDGSWAEHFAASGGAMTLQAGSPTYDVASLLGVGGGDDEGVTGDGTAYWQPAGTAFGDVATEDTIIELLFLGASGAKTLFCKRGATGAGFEIYTNIGSVYLYVEDDSANSVNKQIGTVVPGAAYHLLIVMDRNGGASGLSAYLNNASAAVANIDAVATLTNAAALTICAKSTAATPWDSTASAAGLWMSAPGWLDAGSQADLAAERFWRWTGIYPQLAPRGAYLPTFTRSTIKYYHRTTGSATRPNEAHLGGAGLLAVDDDGVPIHSAQVNKIGYTLPGGTGWTIRGTCSVTGSQTSPSPGDATANKISGVGAIGNDLYRSLGGGTFTNDASLGSGVWFKRDLTTGVVSMYHPSSAALGEWYIDFSLLSDEWEYLTGAHPAVTVQASWTAGPTGVAGFAFKRISGAATLSFYVWHCTLTESTGHVPVPGPPVPDSDGGTATCNADRGTLNSTIAAHLSDRGEGTIELEFKVPDTTTTASRRLFILHDGTANNRIDLSVSNVDQKVELYVSVAGVQQAWFDSVDVTDGEWHKASVAWRKGRISLVVDGSEFVDTDCSIPVFTTFNFGGYKDAGYELGGPLRRMHIWDEARH